MYYPINNLQLFPRLFYDQFMKFGEKKHTFFWDSFGWKMLAKTNVRADINSPKISNFFSDHKLSLWISSIQKLNFHLLQ